jgi:prepilin-type N-terminal cleavage/methylation domain-containing protein
MRRASPRAERRSSDAGLSLIEILVTIVLMGIGVTAILGALQVSTRASAIDQDHAVAFAWLQSASDDLYNTPRESCSGKADAKTEITNIYNLAIQDVPPPAAFPNPAAASINVVDVQFLGKVNPDDDYGWGDTYCLEGGVYASSPQYTQRVTIRVETPRGLVKTLHMVKGES